LVGLYLKGGGGGLPPSFFNKKKLGTTEILA
jgi:hypothetical protein